MKFFNMNPYIQPRTETKTNRILRIVGRVLLRTIDIAFTIFIAMVKVLFFLTIGLLIAIFLGSSRK